MLVVGICIPGGVPSTIILTALPLGFAGGGCGASSPPVLYYTVGFIVVLEELDACLASILSFIQL